MRMTDASQAIIALGVCATVAISVVSIGRAYVSSLDMRKKRPEPDLPPDVHDRMSRIEQAVDAIAIEVERMSEGQRFTTRLLTERLGDGNAAQAVGRRSPADDANGAAGNHAR